LGKAKRFLSAKGAGILAGAIPTADGEPPPYVSPLDEKFILVPTRGIHFKFHEKA
jgi:hypothetical protein